MNTQKVQINQCDMKTDLNLLLECLKSQVDCPLSQQEAVITVYYICQQNKQLSPHLRRICQLETLIPAISSGPQSAALSVPVSTTPSTGQVALKIVEEVQRYSPNW